MFFSRSSRIFCSFSCCLLFISATAFAQEGAETPPAGPVENPPGTTSQGREVAPPEEAPETTPETAPEVAEEAEKPGFKIGVDVYAGLSNLRGNRTFRDGFWIGYGPAFPSVVFGRYVGRDGSTGKLALGVGEIYNEGADALSVDQPVEAWFQKPVGNVNVTAGKFYVPFELQEWQYETKWGVLLQNTQGKWDLAGSLNYNFDTETPNFYLRAGRTLSENVSVGLSVGAGRGLSYNSTHDLGLGLDVAANYRGFELLAGYVGLRGASEDSGRDSDGAFDFGFAKLSYPGLGRTTPFVSYHRWRDRSDQLGNFHSATAGLSYQLTRSVALEGALATSPDGGVTWSQIRWTQEW